MASGVSGLRESFDDSGISLSFDELCNQAGMTREKVAAVSLQQELYKTTYRDLAPSLKGKCRYEVVSGAPSEIKISPQELEGETPKQFNKDYIFDSRSSHTVVKFLAQKDIYPITIEDGELLKEASRAFANIITGTPNEEFQKFVMLATTQIFPVAVSPGLLAHLSDMRSAIMEKNSKVDTSNFQTHIKQITLTFDVAYGWFRSIRSDAFRVKLEGEVDTIHKAAIDPKISSEKKETRSSLGIIPVVQGRVFAEMLCERNAAGQYSFKNITAESSVFVSNVQKI